MKRSFKHRTLSARHFRSRTLHGIVATTTISGDQTLTSTLRRSTASSTDVLRRSTTDSSTVVRRANATTDTTLRRT